jgi:MSHA biogenesis protein MshP
MFRNARGFAATTVIVIVAMLAVFGIALVVTTTTQQQSAVSDLQSARAYQAARAGLEFGIYQSLVNGTCAASTTIGLSGDLAGFRVTVTCTSSSHTEVSTVVNMFQITATGCNLAAGACPAATPPDANYVERQLRVTAGSS